MCMNPPDRQIEKEATEKVSEIEKVRFLRKGRSNKVSEMEI